MYLLLIFDERGGEIMESIREAITAFISGVGFPIACGCVLFGSALKKL